MIKYLIHQLTTKYFIRVIEASKYRVYYRPKFTTNSLSVLTDGMSDLLTCILFSLYCQLALIDNAFSVLEFAILVLDFGFFIENIHESCGHNWINRILMKFTDFQSVKYFL